MLSCQATFFGFKSLSTFPAFLAKQTKMVAFAFKVIRSFSPKLKGDLKYQTLPFAKEWVLRLGLNLLLQTKFMYFQD